MIAGGARSGGHELGTGTVLGQRYRIVRKLGGGGMGVVYEAQQLDLGRRVAIKTLRGELRGDRAQMQRFHREAHVVASLHHPNIVQISDFVDRPPEPAFLVMEHFDAPSLREIAERGPLSIARLGGIALQVLAALDAAHAAGIVHRDLKAGNVIVVPLAGGGDLVKLIDFGAAHLTEGEAWKKLTKTGVLIGTPVYMSPEQARGLPVDGRTDVYGLGIMLYQLIAGRRAFKGATFEELLPQILSTDPTPLWEIEPSVPRAVARVVHRALRKAPDERFSSAREMAADLQSALSDGEATRRIDPRDVTDDDQATRRLDPGRTLLRESGAAPAVERVPIKPASMAVTAPAPVRQSAPGPRAKQAQFTPALAARRARSRRRWAVSLVAALLIAGTAAATFVLLARTGGHGAAEVATSGASAPLERSGSGALARSRAPVPVSAATTSAVGAPLPGAAPASSAAPSSPAPSSLASSAAASSSASTPTDPAPSTTTPSSPSAAPAGASEVDITFVISPAEAARTARLFIDDIEYPTTTFSIPRSFEPHRLRVEARGYRALNLPITFDRDRLLEVGLEPLHHAPRHGAAAAEPAPVPARAGEVEISNPWN